MDSSLPYQIALTMVPQLGPVHGRSLLEQFQPEVLFKTPLSDLESIERLGTLRAQSIFKFNDWKAVEEEIEFIEKNKIDTFFIGNKNYPKRLLHCPDAPLLLYSKGQALLNADRMLAIVGTRRNSETGRRSTEKLIEELREANVSIISGMAYGIDTIAHRSALYHKIPTIGVLAHGLDRIYPASNRGLAREICKQGGLLVTENRRGIQADKYLFPKRNRIVAGMTDATIVIESDLKGGSLITASLAADYGRDVFAVPGRPTDPASRGCLDLIKTQRALLLTSARDILEWLGWATSAETSAENEKKRSVATKESLVLSGMSEDEILIYKIIGAEEESSFESLIRASGWTVTRLSNALLNIELAGLIVSLPGNRYQIA